MGSDTKILKSLKKTEGVIEIHSLYGVYDFIAKAEGENMEELREILNRGIKRINGVKSTLTMIVVE